MTIPVSNVALTNTFEFQRTIINQLASGMSTYAVTTNQNVATGNAIVNGYIQANGIVANSLTINGGVGVVSVANIICNYITVNNVTTTANLISSGTATLNIANLTSASIVTLIGNTVSGNVATFVNVTSTGTTTIANLSLSVLNNSLTQANISTAYITNQFSNVLTVNTSIKIGNTSANVTIIAPNTVQQSTSYYLSGNGTWAPAATGTANVAGSDTYVQFNTNNAMDATAGFTFNKTSNIAFVSNAISAPIHQVGNNQIQQIYVFTTNTATQQIDSWPLANWAGAHYKVAMYQVNTVNALAASYMIVTGANSGTFSMLEYGIANTGPLLGTFSVTTNATHASFSVTPAVANTVINLNRTLLSI